LPGAERNGGNDSVVIPATELKTAILYSLEVLGPNMVRATIEELARNGIDLDSKSASYSLNEVRERLEMLFGEASTMMVDRIKEQLKFEN
jgi:hypothetical protein